MRKRLLVVLLVLTGLFVGTVPVSAHTTHSHAGCYTHGWQSDGNGWRHISYPVPAAPGYIRAEQNHQVWVLTSNKYVTQHYTWSAMCPA